MVADVNVGLELGKIAEVVEKAFADRRDRKLGRWEELREDVEHLRTVVQRLSGLYVDVLEAVQWSAAGPDGGAEDRDQLIKELHDFLHDDRVIGQLANLQARIQHASQDHHLRRRRYRPVVEQLRGLEQAAGGYLAFMNEVREGKVQADSRGERLWNLAEVLEALETGRSELPVRDLCEEAIRNRRVDLVIAIEQTAGRTLDVIRWL